MGGGSTLPVEVVADNIGTLWTLLCVGVPQTDANLPSPARDHKIVVTLLRWLRRRYKQSLPGNIAIVANISDASNIFNFTVGDNAEK